MIIGVKIGYNSPIMFKGESEAWKLINDVFSAAFSAENPEDMPIEVEFKKEVEEDENDAV